MFIKKLFPIYWRYLLSIYLKGFVFLQLCFIFLLLVISAKDIFLFASVKTSFWNGVIFALIQLPYILPITIPFSLLISSILLVYKLHQTKELAAFRALGLSLQKLFTPIFILLPFLFLVSLITVSEITPYCLQKSKKMVYESTTQNPLAILQRKDLLKYPDLYLQSETIDDNHLQNVLIAHRDPSKNRLSLIQAKHLISDKESLIGTDICAISYINENESPMLFIENQKKMAIEKKSFAKNLKKSKLKKSLFTLPMRPLLIKQKKDLKKHIAIDLEILRRFSIALFALSFPLLGLTINMANFRKKLILISSACFLALICHFSIRHMDSSFTLALSFSILPSLLMIFYSLWYFYNNSKRAT